MDDSIWWALYRCLRHYLGLWKTRTMKAEFLRWQMYNHWPKDCAGCGKHTTKSERTLDHIIPVELCIALDMPMLMFDWRNFQILCNPCNQKKGNKIHMLPESVRKALEQRRSLLKIT